MAQTASMRDAHGRILVELARENPDIVVINADLCRSTMPGIYPDDFPGRFFDVGIAEQNMVGIAAGLAASGKIPFASTFAVFIPGRCFDQIRMSVAQPHLNVKLVATHGGISVGEDGTSHQGIEDLALACSLPGLNVIVPADAIETFQALRVAADTYGPFYIRLGRPALPIVFNEDYHFTLGKAVVMKQGNDATIIAIGVMVAIALEAAGNLKREGIDCRVLNMSTLKPVDESAVIQSAVETGAIVTAEEHLQHGGLGSTVAQIVATHRPVPMELVAIKDTYAGSGKPAELMQKYGLTARDIEQGIRSAIKRK